MSKTKAMPSRRPDANAEREIVHMWLTSGDASRGERNHEYGFIGLSMGTGHG
jgi:hypothetical protein